MSDGYYTNLRAVVPVFFVAVCFALLPFKPVLADISADENAAVVFVYQQVGEDASAQGNLSLDLFEAHIKELQAGKYNVVPLADIARAMNGKGNSLPPRSIALTFDGAWRQTMDNVLPLLKEAKLPFTVFYASSMADGDSTAHLTWPELKKLKKNKYATLGILPSGYVHMADHKKDANLALINTATSRYREVFKEEPAFFAWPYGEYPEDVKAELGKYAFTAAFGQQSGVVHKQSDMMALPRFVMTDDYGDIDRFRLTANALPLPVADIVPGNRVFSEKPPIIIGFTVTPDIADISRLSCFVADVGKVELAKPSTNRVEIRLDTPLPDRRTRINCTIPVGEDVPGLEQRWRWFGMILVSGEG